MNIFCSDCKPVDVDAFEHLKDKHNDCIVYNSCNELLNLTENKEKKKILLYNGIIFLIQIKLLNKKIWHFATILDEAKLAPLFKVIVKYSSENGSIIKEYEVLTANKIHALNENNGIGIKLSTLNKELGNYYEMDFTICIERVEDICIDECLVCPECDFIGEDIFHHFKEKHSDLIFSSPYDNLYDIKQSKDVTKLLTFNKFTFLINIKFVNYKLWHFATILDDTKLAPLFKFVVKYSTEKSAVIKEKTVGGQFRNYKLNKNDGIGIDVSTLFEELGNYDKLMFSLSICITKSNCHFCKSELTTAPVFKEYNYYLCSTCQETFTSNFNDYDSKIINKKLSWFRQIYYMMILFNFFVFTIYAYVSYVLVFSAVSFCNLVCTYLLSCVYFLFLFLFSCDLRSKMVLIFLVTMCWGCIRFLARYESFLVHYIIFVFYIIIMAIIVCYYVFRCCLLAMI